MSDHARLSPSARHRWSVCPGSVRLEAAIPQPPSGASAVDGTHSHTLLEACIKGGLRDPFAYVGQEMRDHEGTFTVDNDRAARVKVAVDYIKDRLTAVGFDDHQDAVAAGAVLSEQRVNPAALVGRDDMAGTVDTQIVIPGVLEIVDYKDGVHAVDAVDNPQLEVYAFGSLAANVDALRIWHTVRMTIVQPKLAAFGKPAISTWEISTVDLMKRLPDLIAQAARTDDPDAPTVPEKKACSFCRAKSSCSAFVSLSMSEVGVMFKPVTDVTVSSPVEIAQQAADKDPAGMNDDQIRQLVEAAPLLRQLLDAVETEAQRRLEAGQSIPGLKLVNGRGSRSWSLTEDEMAEKLVKFGIPKPSVYVKKLVSPAQVEKLVWEKRDGTKVSLSPKQIERLESEYVVKTYGKPVVALESDRRPAVVVNAAPMFGAVSSDLPSWLQ